MLFRLFRFLVPGFFLFSVISGCKTSDTYYEGQGSIEFEVECINKDHPLAPLAPSSAVLKYNKDKFILEMSTMGIFKTSIIGDNEKKTIAQTVKFMDIKQACIENEDMIKEENEKYKLKFTETKDTKKIAGLVCKKVRAEFVDKPGEFFDVYYTTHFGLENCNLLTPYAEVKGMLLDYRLRRMGLELRFKAKKIKNQEVPLSTFEIPAYMKIISKKEMEDFFRNIQ